MSKNITFGENIYNMQESTSICNTLLNTSRLKQESKNKKSVRPSIATVMENICKKSINLTINIYS